MCAEALWGTIKSMQEVSSKPGESEKPLNEQENWVLEILDWTGSWRPGFAVQQARGFLNLPCDLICLGEEADKKRHLGL